VIDGNDSDDLEQLLSRADMAMYEAKSKGGNRYCHYEPEIQLRTSNRRGFEQDLVRAVENGDFELHYQPLVDLQTKRICGVEALLRWNSPQRGDLSPASFIPVAEE